MRILVLNPPFKPEKGKYSTWSRSPAITKSGTVYYPIYLASATGVLEQEGHDVILIDACANRLLYDKLISKIRWYEPRLIVVNTTTPSIYNDIEIGHRLNLEFDNAILVFVGTHVSAVPEETLELLNDYEIIAIGEYEYILRDLASAIVNNQNFKTVKGIIYKEDDKVVKTDLALPIPAKDLDTFPFLSDTYRNHLNINNYFFGAAKYPLVQILTSRGCPNFCTFCNLPHVFHGRKFRQRSPQNVVDEFNYIKEDLNGIKEVGIEDDTFSINPGFVKEFCKLKIKSKNGLYWYCNVRADIDLDLLPLMKKAGCKLVTVGFESGNQKILDNIKKGITLKQIKKFVKATKKTNILVHAAWMVGNIGETKETMEQTLKLAKELDTDMAQFFPVMLYPGTYSYDWAVKNGYLTETDYSKWLDEDGQYNCLLNTPDLSADELVAFCDRALKEYYTRPKYLLKKTWQGLTQPGELYRNLKSAKQLTLNLMRKR